MFYNLPWHLLFIAAFICSLDIKKSAWDSSLTSSRSIFPSIPEPGKCVSSYLMLMCVNDLTVDMFNGLLSNLQLRGPLPKVILQFLH